MVGRPRQFALCIRSWGGRRRGAGRKPAPGRHTPHTGRARRMTRGARCTSRSARGAPSRRFGMTPSSAPSAAPSQPLPTTRSAFSSTASNPIISTCSWRRTGRRGSRAGCRGSPSVWPGRSTACCGGGEAYGTGAIMRTRFAHRGRSATRSCTCSRTSRSTFATWSDSIPVRRRRGFRDGVRSLQRRWIPHRWSRLAPGWRGPGGGGTVCSAWGKRRGVRERGARGRWRRRAAERPQS